MSHRQACRESKAFVAFRNSVNAAGYYKEQAARVSSEIAAESMSDDKREVKVMALAYYVGRQAEHWRDACRIARRM